MFAKLKKKIEEEAQTDLGKTLPTTSATPSPISKRKTGNSRHGSPSRLGSYERERRASASSTDSKDSYRPTAESSDDVSSLLRTKTDQLKRLEMRLQEYYCALKEQLNSKTILEEELEKQKLFTSSTLQKKDEECKLKLDQLEAEKCELQLKLDSAKKLHNSYIEKQEVIDELEGFQTQEMAKVKHLLLNCQQEVQNKEESLKVALNELDIAKSTLTRLESENKAFSEKLDKEETERIALKDKDEQNLAIIEDLQEVKRSLVDQVTSLKMELEENNTRNNKLESMLGELQDENDALHHSQEVYSESSAKSLEVKSNLISHLEERIVILEQRVADSNLNGDAQMDAIIHERDNLEKKLEESRQHLIDIKSTWSEKIMSLEKQISHLNKKMAEDSLEIQKAEEHAESIQKSSQEKIFKLNEELNKVNSKCSDLKKTLEEREKHWKEEIVTLENEIFVLRKSKEDNIKELTDTIRRLEDAMAGLENEKGIELEGCNEKIKNLEGLEEEARETINKLNKSNEEFQVMVDNKEKEVSCLTKCVEERDEQLREKEKIVEDLKREKRDCEITCNKLKEQLIEAGQQIEMLTKELEDNKSTLTKLEMALEHCNKERENLTQSAQEIDSVSDTLRMENNKLKQMLAEAEELAKSNIEKSDQMIELKKSVSNLENELLDRNKTIKLQQQRINDMKKTLQREFKMQAGGPLDVTNGEGPASDTTSSVLMTSSFTSKDVEIMQKIQSLETSESSLYEDINFRYLKHVILKFMTSREYEAQHLIKAVSVLLHFTPEEEKLIRETLDWKMSWFSPRPKFGSGQLAKTIPMT